MKKQKQKQMDYTAKADMGRGEWGSANLENLPYLILRLIIKLQ